MKLATDIFTEPVITHSFSVEQLNNNKVDSNLSKRLSYHRIVLVENGKGKLTIDNNTFQIECHEIFLMSKGQVYRFDNATEITGYMISFGDCFWEQTPNSAGNCKAVLFNNTTANQRLKLNNSEMNELAFLFNALLNEYQLPQYINQMDALAAYLKIIMIKLANVKLVEESTFDSQDYILYRKFMELLSKEYCTCHSVSDYAKMLNITGRRLTEICKRCNGMSSKEIISGQIIAEAKRALQFSAHSVKEIAHSLNFNNAGQFSHFFKKNTKSSPENYRNRFMSVERRDI